MYADWTDRIADGELPNAAPSRPQGRERNVVVTMWDWADPKVYLHDAISSDKRNPTVNANGPIYGALEESGDYLTVARSDAQRDEPGEADGSRSADAEFREHEARRAVAVLGRRGDLEQPDDGSQLRHGQAGSRVGRGARPQASNAGMVSGGIGSSVGEVVPDHSGPAGAGALRSENQRDDHHRHLLHLGPREFRRQRCAVVVVRACRRRGMVRHQDLGQDARREEGAGLERVRPRLQRKREARRLHRTESAGRSHQGQADQRVVLRRLAGAGRLGLGIGPGNARRAGSFHPRIAPARDGAGRVLRGAVEQSEGAGARLRASRHGRRQQGRRLDGAVERTFASFDRSKCKGPLNGPTAATGQHCPEGWTLYPFPGPNYKGAVENGSADSAYYNFVDRFDMLGVGKDVPLATGNLSEGLLALVDGKFLTLRVPYPMGYYAKGLDGRIDNPNGGWKGKGIYTPISTRAPFHMEGGKGTTSKLVKFQMRPNPLAN